MKKRTFLKTGLFFGVATATSSFLDACKTAGKNPESVTAYPVIPPPKLRRTTPFELPKLPYAKEALEPHIDKMTMEIHHDRHHQGYVNKLNDAVKNTVYADYELYDIVARVTTSDEDRNIRNNAGGHWNHSFFWETMSPDGGGAPGGELATAISKQFGSFDELKNLFGTAAKGVFGSGWAWLCVGKDKGLFVTSTPNQDNPLMLGVVQKTGTPILGIDVWEHAYYLKYQNKRPDYVSAFFNVINWKEIGMRYEKAMFG